MRGHGRSPGLLGVRGDRGERELLLDRKGSHQGNGSACSCAARATYRGAPAGSVVGELRGGGVPTRSVVCARQAARRSQSEQRLGRR